MVLSPLPDTEAVRVAVFVRPIQGRATHLNPRMIPAHDRDIHLVEPKFCPDTNPLPSLRTAAEQRAGTIYDDYTITPLGSSGRDVTGGEAVQSRRMRVYARRRMAESNPPDPHQLFPIKYQWKSYGITYHTSGVGGILKYLASTTNELASLHTAHSTCSQAVKIISDLKAECHNVTGKMIAKALSKSPVGTDLIIQKEKLCRQNFFVGKCGFSSPNLINSAQRTDSARQSEWVLPESGPGQKYLATTLSGVLFYRRTESGRVQHGLHPN
eukprot:1159084-Pelagomonas_calceolata.AAC.9